MSTIDAGIYSRLSKKRKTADNPEGLSENVTIQIAEGQSYAEEKLWTVVIDPELTQDDDISASKFSTKPRPGYDRLLAAIEAGRVEIIICTEMTRLYRRMEELLQLIKLAERTRLRGIWTTDDEGYDLSTPEGIHAAIGAVNNAMLESAKLSRRQKRKKDAQARQGKRSGGGRPFGYEKDGITLKPDEVAILVEAKNRYLAGETMRSIVRDFYHRGVVSPYGKPWEVQNFQRVLFNRRYVGVRVHHGDEYPALWPAIWTEAEWQQMNLHKQARAAKWPGRGRGMGRTYLLTGLLVCGRCGGYMVGSRRDTKKGHQRRYKCRLYDNHNVKVGCGKVYRLADALDEFVSEAVLYRLESPAVARLLANGEDEDDTEELLRDYQAAKDNLDRMTADYASGFLTREEFAVAKVVAENRLEAARQALSEIRQERHFPADISTIRQLWPTADIEWRHSVIAKVVEKIRVLPGHPGSMRWSTYRFNPDLTEIIWKC